MTTTRDRSRALGRFARAHAAIAASKQRRAEAVQELRDMGVTFKEIGEHADPPMTPEGVKMILGRAGR